MSYWGNTYLPDLWAAREAARYDERLIRPEDAREYFEWLAHIEELPAGDEDPWRWEFHLLSAEEVAEFEEWLRDSRGLDNINNTNTNTNTKE